MVPARLTQPAGGTGNHARRRLLRYRHRWSTVHVDDLADLYHLALTDPAAAGFYFVEGGRDASFLEIGGVIAQRMGLRPLQPWELGSAAPPGGRGSPATRSAPTVACAPPGPVPRPARQPLEPIDNRLDRTRHALAAT